MQITLPELTLVVLIGPSGSGKSTFAATHFKPTEVLSSDACRALVSDDENNQSATRDAFEVLHLIARKRLAAGRLTVVDATNVQPEARKPLLALAREYHMQAAAIVFNLPERICHQRNEARPDRNFGPHVIRRQSADLRRSLRGLKREGFRHVFVLESADDVAEVTLVRQPMWNNRQEEHGPFDIIGDVHGCFDELVELLHTLGYQQRDIDGVYAHPAGRKAIFLGDLVDRGPAVPAVLRLVMDMVAAGTALCVPGNHDVKLVRKLRGRDVKIAHGLAETLQQLEAESAEFRSQVVSFLDGLISHYVLDAGKLVVAHAGLKQCMHGRGSAQVRDFALYGETTGETDEFGLPVRYNWAAEYRGAAMVVYGHTPVPQPEWLNHTINIDTGCVFGGRLTALRYPEQELVSVAAQQVYAEPIRPLQPTGSLPSSQQQHDDVLDLADVTGRRHIATRLHGTVIVREEQTAAALEVMSRFAANPKWLIYLPPTMSPAETTQHPDLLEHPAEAFEYYRRNDVATVICQEKHMGSRAVVVLCRDEQAAQRRFGVVGEGRGICYTRTGRRFFDDPGLEAELLNRLDQAITASELWDELNTDWLCLDCELMPWSAKAQDLIRTQYAAVGAAGRLAFAHVLPVLEQAQQRGLDVGDLHAWYNERATMMAQYTETYGRYGWPVTSIDDLRLAPFHLLASEGAVHTNRDHRWHMQIAARLAEYDSSSTLQATATQLIDLNDSDQVQQGIRWWEDLTARGGEGMVVKPLYWTVRHGKRLVQPAIKCRGREYLRIIYGPEYTAPANLQRLRQRNVGRKRSLALREFALGIEGLERFVAGKPLRDVHECVFGVLALESEPVDPRL